MYCSVSGARWLPACSHYPDDTSCRINIQSGIVAVSVICMGVQWRITEATIHRIELRFLILTPTPSTSGSEWFCSSEIAWWSSWMSEILLSSTGTTTASFGTSDWASIACTEYVVGQFSVPSEFPVSKHPDSIGETNRMVETNWRREGILQW